jgi:hypothetical protein
MEGYKKTKQLQQTFSPIMKQDGYWAKMAMVKI